MRIPSFGAVALVIGLAVPAHEAAAHDHHHKHHGHGGHHGQSGPPSAVQAEKTAVKLRDHDVVDQDGRAIKFARDAVGGKIVVVSFVYTTCTTVCPVISSVMANVQGLVAEPAASDIALLSISTDPVTDVPQRLRSYAQRFSPSPWWTWITGSKANVEQVLRDFGAYAPDFRNHVPIVLVGDAARGEWSRYYGIPDPAAIAARVGELRRSREKSTMLPKG